MSKLLSRSRNKFCTTKEKWLGDAEVRRVRRFYVCVCPKFFFRCMSGG